MEKVIKKDENKVITPKTFRRDVRMLKKKRRGYELTNYGKKIGASRFNVIGISIWNPQAIFIPKKTKLKGWQKAKK